MLKAKRRQKNEDDIKVKVYSKAQLARMNEFMKKRLRISTVSLGSDEESS